MTIGRTGVKELDLEFVAHESLEQLERTLRSGQDAFLRAECEIEPLPPLKWLQQHPAGSRGYWSDRDGEFELAGIGAADVITGEGVVDPKTLVAQLQQRIEGSSSPIRYFGGMRFSSETTPSSEWERFKSYRFILPRFELSRREDRYVFTCNMRRDESLEDVSIALQSLRNTEALHTPSWAAPLNRSNKPTLDEWQTVMEKALNLVEEKHLEKVVLSRRLSFNFEEPVDPALLLSRLRHITNQRFHFCFQPGPGSAFLGASPERLFRREGRALATEALAGTQRRDPASGKDEALRKAFYENEKERSEHEMVVTGIRDALEPLMNRLTWDSTPTILELSRTIHLKSTFEGTLKDDVGDADLLFHLHPTPAVGGSPREKALSAIHQLEDFDRGWFAGPVGWITRDEAQFAVGIRSALVQSEKVHVYSGAGVVAGSNPESEWEELENKVSDFLVAMGSDD